MDILNNKHEDLTAVSAKYKNQYANAEPFPNIVFEDFFSSEFLLAVLKEFDDLGKKDSITLNHKNSLKTASKNSLQFGHYTKTLVNYLNSEEFLIFLKDLTGMERLLIPDPYLFGGGQHEIKRGGFLKIHADFNKHKDLELDRRLNLLIYLNENWKEEYGGDFEMWSKDMKKCEKKVSPRFNTMAIFSTTSDSYHGHPEPLKCPEGMSRKSIALYYYTNGRPEREVIKGLEKHSTLYKSRPNDINIFSYLSLLTPPLIPIIFKKIFKNKT